MKNATTQLSDDESQKLIELYGSVYSGMQKSVSGFTALQTATLAELKGMFTREEIISMTDSLNGSMHEDRYMANKKMMLYGLEDAELLDKRFTSHDASFEDFRVKFKSLTSAQCYFLIEEIRRFWDDKAAYGAPTPDLEKLIEKLC